MDLNDLLRLASIWCGLLLVAQAAMPMMLLGVRCGSRSRTLRHSLGAISTQLSPLPGCSGIELLEADTFALHSLQAPTGTKFLLVVEPRAPYIPAMLQRCGQTHCDATCDAHSC